MLSGSLVPTTQKHHCRARNDRVTSTTRRTRSHTSRHRATRFCRSQRVRLMFTSKHSTPSELDISASLGRAVTSRLADGFAGSMYMLALILNAANAGMDAELSQMASKKWHEFGETVPEQFDGRVERWLAVQAFKGLALLLAWLVVRCNTVLQFACSQMNGSGCFDRLHLAFASAVGADSRPSCR